MKAKELIELLSKLPATAEIVLPGQEGGFNSNIQVSVKPIELLGNYYVQDYYGDHEAKVRGIVRDHPKKLQFKAYVLQGFKQFKTARD